MDVVIKEKWTPGPWYCSPSVDALNLNNGEPYEYIIQGSNELGGGPVLPILGRTHNWPDNFAANAHLISAAPELYEALAKIMEMHDHGIPLVFSIRSQARSALHKARGESEVSK